MKTTLFFLGLLFSSFFLNSFTRFSFASESSPCKYAMLNSIVRSQLEEFIPPFLGAIAKEETNYILYARPHGALGDQLHTFWNDVKDQNLDNPAVLIYPPHITLTGFFPIKKSQNENDLKSALKAALKKVNRIPIIIKGDSIIQKDDLDYIPFLYSSTLNSVSEDFLKNAKISLTYLRPKLKSKIGYHLSLRDNTDVETTAKVRELEENDIHLGMPDLQTETTWALYIYKKTGAKGTLKPVYKQDIQTE